MHVYVLNRGTVHLEQALLLNLLHVECMQVYFVIIDFNPVYVAIQFSSA